MKRITKSSGSGGRLRLGLLLVTAAAFLLVPAAQALAVTPVANVVFEGEGSGWVKGNSPSGQGGGTPYLECHWNGTEINVDLPPGSGKCETQSDNVGIGSGAIGLKAELDSGSELVGWVVEEGVIFGGCENPAASQEEECLVITFGGPIKVKAIFALEPIIPKYPLNLTASGAPGGEFECSINGGAVGPCPAEVEETKSVEVFATGTGVELNEWTTGPCAGSSSSPCSFTMPASAVSANAEFKVASESLSVTIGGGGEGSVACEVNGSPASCNETYSYGDSVKVVATPAAENVVESLTGTGSAAGNCNAETGICEFTLTAPSSVTAIFEPAGTKAQTEGNVHGEVPITTSLESGCSDVDLGEFIPGLTADYSKTCGLTLTTTGEETTLTAKDESATHTGHLVQGSYFLPSALEAKATDSEEKGTGPGLTPLSPVTLLTFPVPVSKDATTLEFNQHIGEHDGLHTGVYSKTITLILEQIKP